MSEKNSFATIDEYIAQYPAELQSVLNELRGVIRRAAPDAQEKISWQMPTFFQNGNLVHFAVHKHHIGFYPGAGGIEAFADRLGEYKTSKGAVQFPIGKPLPYALIDEIVKFRVKENRKES